MASLHVLDRLLVNTQAPINRTVNHIYLLSTSNRAYQIRQHPDANQLFCSSTQSQAAPSNPVYKMSQQLANRTAHIVDLLGGRQHTGFLNAGLEEQLGYFFFSPYSKVPARWYQVWEPTVMFRSSKISDNMYPIRSPPHQVHFHTLSMATNDMQERRRPLGT
jgi:hypothetical protein